MRASKFNHRGPDVVIALISDREPRQVFLLQGEVEFFSCANDCDETGLLVVSAELSTFGSLYAELVSIFLIPRIGSQPRRCQAPAAPDRLGVPRSYTPLSGELPGVPAGTVSREGQAIETPQCGPRSPFLQR